MPHCTSSKISSAPAARVSSRAAAGYSAPEVDRAGEPLHRLDDQRRDVRRPAPPPAAARSPRGTKVTSNGARGKPYHFSDLWLTAAAAAVRPWKAPSSATIAGPARMPEGEAQRVLVRLGAAVDQEGAGEPGRPEAHQPLGRPGADGERHRVALEEQLLGLRASAATSRGWR